MKKVVFNIGPNSFTTSAFIIGLILVQQLSAEEQDSIGNWLQLIGLTMQTYASQVSTLNATDKESNSCDMETLKATIKKIEHELEKFSNQSHAD